MKIIRSIEPIILSYISSAQLISIKEISEDYAVYNIYTIQYTHGNYGFNKIYFYFSVSKSVFTLDWLILYSLALN